MIAIQWAAECALKRSDLPAKSHPAGSAGYFQCANKNAAFVAIGNGKPVQPPGWSSLDHLMTAFACFQNCDSPLQFEDLLQERPIEEIIELAAGGQGAYFQATMTFAGHSG